MRTILKVSIHSEDANPIFGEGAVFVELCDDAAGQYVEITDTDGGGIKLDFETLDEVVVVARELRTDHGVD